MGAIPKDSRAWWLFCIRLSPVVALALSSVLAGFCLGFGALYVYSWLWADPACHCPVEKIEGARARANELVLIGTVLSVAASCAFFWLGRKLMMPRSIRAPLPASLAIAVLLSAVVALLPASAGRFSHVPVELVAPAVLIQPIRLLSDSLQSWRFVVFVVFWTVAYVVLHVIGKAKAKT